MRFVAVLVTCLAVAVRLLFTTRFSPHVTSIMEASYYAPSVFQLVTLTLIAVLVSIFFLPSSEPNERASPSLSSLRRSVRTAPFAKARRRVARMRMEATDVVPMPTASAAQAKCTVAHLEVHAM